MTEENIEKLINRLNQSLEYDRDAITELFSIRVLCNDSLADAPHFQVRCYDKTYEETGKCSIGVLGLLNGLIDDGNDGIIFASYNDDGTIEKFFTKKNN